MFVFDGWNVADGFEQPAGVPPVHPGERGEFDVVDGAPRSARVDEFALVETDDRFSHGVVVAVATGADRRDGAGLGEPFRVADG